MLRAVHLFQLQALVHNCTLFLETERLLIVIICTTLITSRVVAKERHFFANTFWVFRLEGWAFIGIYLQFLNIFIISTDLCLSVLVTKSQLVFKIFDPFSSDILKLEMIAHSNFYVLSYVSWHETLCYFVILKSFLLFNKSIDNGIGDLDAIYESRVWIFDASIPRTSHRRRLGRQQLFWRLHCSLSRRRSRLIFHIYSFWHAL